VLPDHQIRGSAKERSCTCPCISDGALDDERNVCCMRAREAKAGTHLFACARVKRCETLHPFSGTGIDS
jgi:hypothetical protein